MMPLVRCFRAANGYHHDNMPIKVIYNNCRPALPFLFAGIGSLPELKSAFSLADSDGTWIVDAWIVWSFLNTKIVRAAIGRCTGTSCRSAAQAKMVPMVIFLLEEYICGGGIVEPTTTRSRQHGGSGPR
jgi:hypothetical protein